MLILSGDHIYKMDYMKMIHYHRTVEADVTIAAIETPFEIGDSKMRLSASVGVAITEERCTRPDEVLRDADAALFQAKLQGPGRYAMFDRAMRHQITPSTAERRLRAALACST